MRRKQYEEWLEEYLSAFRRRAEQHIVRIPRLVRDVTLRDFAKYNGNIHECLTSLQMGNLGGAAMTIDKSTRKRKWIESQESEVGRDSKAGTFVWKVDCKYLSLTKEQLVLLRLHLRRPVPPTFRRTLDFRLRLQQQ